MAAPLLDRAADASVFTEDVDHRIIVHLLGRNIFAISGGRVVKRPTGITLPNHAGYSVEIDLAASDTYTVRRIFKRGDKVWIKGEETEVYAEDLADSAYRASCYVNVKFGDHDPMA
jgi:hypothetical protein